MSSSSSFSIGIDLGTTYSCVGVWRGERVEIITNDYGNRTTPSCVGFTPDRRHIGEMAQDLALWNASSTVFGVKRMIGRYYDDPYLKRDIKLMPFKVRNQGGKPVIEVAFQGEAHQFTPEQISAMILLKMKQTAELVLGAVKDVVITVPAYFNNIQRKSTKAAGASVGLNFLQILAEPTAAALAYGLHTNSARKKHVLVYDLGGGTFDVSMLTIEGSSFKVLSTSGDTHLGGENFDTLLVEHFAKEFNKKHRCDISTNPRAMRRLKVACERAKRNLSSETVAAIELDSLYNGLDLITVLTRAKFEEICGHLFTSTLGYISNALEDAHLPKERIDEVLLSGGHLEFLKSNNSYLRSFPERS
ncbi:Heat shock 70 kDa protein [Entomophthora muscae]|uniref:Heat shock 70 kDa protein n=1 Tax=Entomophthora muscae TaxID=34485 RepID=A0ACC2RPW1_9FUNG|nr:Heat shock 70 kDa protein [Entomophthora muscae]